MHIKLFMVSGEESGDMHGSSLIEALKRRTGGALTIGGMGGAMMIKAGLKGADSRNISVVGLTEVIEKFPKILKAFNSLKKELLSGSFDAVLLIDFPDFNLRLAREAKKTGLPVIYYISPQVWAWRKGRIKKIASLVDKMLVVFPFEEELYRKEAVDVEYVGHPLKDTAVCGLSPEEARRALNLPAEGKIVALLPGSRSSEVKRLLPVLLGAAKIISRELNSKVSFIIPQASSIDDSVISKPLKDSGVDATAVKNKPYESLRASDAAIVASGTATLETALIGTPMVILYKMSRLTYGVAKALVGVEFIGLPNIIAGKKIVEELIQNEATAQNAAKAAIEILRDFKKRNDIINGYKRVSERLGAGATDKAAAAVLKVISEKRAAALKFR